MRDRRRRAAPVRGLAALAPLGALALAGCSLEGTADVPGDVNRFDPVAALPAVLAFAGPGSKLVKLEARFVREDGTQDLEASYVGYSSVNAYKLVRPTTRRDDPSVPVGARPATSPFEEVEATVEKPHWVTVSHNGGKGSSYKHLGMRLGSPSNTTSPGALAAPACAFTTLWAAARTRGAPAGAVAVITYDASGYDFHIDGTAVKLRFDASCRPSP